MKRKLQIMVACISLLFSTLCFADGNYQISQEDGAYYFDTDNDGSWQINRSDLKYFKGNQAGTYRTGRDKSGTYILTDTKFKVYLDLQAKNQQDKESAIINYNYQQNEKARQKQAAIEEAQRKKIEVQEEQARADRKARQEIDEKKLEQQQAQHEDDMKIQKQMIKALNKRPVVVIP